MKELVKLGAVGFGFGFGLFAGCCAFLYGANIGYLAKENADEDENCAKILDKLDDTNFELAETVTGMKEAGTL